MTRVSANASTTRIAADCDSDDGSLTDCFNVGASAAAGIVETSGSMELCLCIITNTRYRKMQPVVTLPKNDRDSMRSVVVGLCPGPALENLATFSPRRNRICHCNGRRHGAV